MRRKLMGLLVAVLMVSLGSGAFAAKTGTSKKAGLTAEQKVQLKQLKKEQKQKIAKVRSARSAGMSTASVADKKAKKMSARAETKKIKAEYREKKKKILGK